jgi:hypothetical protein
VQAPCFLVAGRASILQCQRQVNALAADQQARVSSWSLNCHVDHLGIPIGLMKRIMAAFTDYLDEQSKPQ